MKKVLLVVLLCGCLVGCGKKVEADVVSSSVEETTTESSAETITQPAENRELNEVKLDASTYQIVQRDGHTIILYAVSISNPNQDYAIQFPKITITAKDKEGKILKTEEQTLSGIAAGDSYSYGNTITYDGDSPETVEINAGNGDDDYVVQSDSGIIKDDDLTITNTSANAGTPITFTGEVTNNSSKDLNQVAMIVLYMSNGNVTCGETSYVDDLKAGETKTFEIKAFSGYSGYDSAMFVALQW